MSIEPILKEFDEKFPCIQGNCNNNGTISVGSEETGCEAEQCQYCYENRLPFKDFLSQKLKEYAVSELEGILKSTRPAVQEDAFMKLLERIKALRGE